MRIRTVVLSAVCLIVIVTAVNLLSDNFTLLHSNLPGNRVEQARREALQKPFYEREHRLERRPRLESRLQVEAKPDDEEGGTKAAQLGNTQLLEKTGLDRPTITADAVLQSKKEESKEQASLQGKARRSTRPVKESKGKEAPAQYRVLATVDGATYTQWQIRICYFWYKRMKTDWPDSALGGFTRLLHSGKSDEFMDEIPTVVVDPLPPGVDEGYPVLNRPYAIMQFVQKYMHNIKEKYILMAEPDHIFVRPPPLWATPSMAAAYPFSYIEPQKNAALVGRFNEKNASLVDIAPIGNSPVMIHRDQLASMVELWYKLSLRMKRDKEADKAFGWILEMYAFAISSAQAPGGPIKYELHPEWMAQPPFDVQYKIQGKEIYFIHYTYGLDYDAEGRNTYGQRAEWHFDKRDFSSAYPPKTGFALPTAKMDTPVITHLLNCINEAVAELEPWGSQSVS